MSDATSQDELDALESKSCTKVKFFNYVHYVLSGALAGVVVAGVVTPALGLTETQSGEVLGAVMGALSVAVIKASRLA